MRGVLQLSPVLSDIYRSGILRLPSGGSWRADHYGMPPAEGEQLYEIVRRETPRTTLEVGMAFGLSTLFICAALREGGGRRHIVMDPNQHRDYQGMGLHHVERAGFSDLVEFHGDSSHRVL